MSHLDCLFNPDSVALIGASADPFKYGYWTAKSLIDHGFEGELYFVSKTKAPSIFGKKPYPSILDIEGPVDLAVIGVSIRFIVDTLMECVEKGVKSVVIVTTGFGEAGEEGKAVEAQLLDIARKHNLRMMGPNCMGMYNADRSLNTSIVGLEPGGISLVLQSGNFGIDINVNAQGRGLGYSKWATIGNQRDLRFFDFIRHIKEDAATRVLLLYMEGLFVDSVQDGRRFLEEARDASRNMPLIGIKIGRSQAGARAAASHTGSLAGSEQIFDAALKQCGVLRLDSSGELLDVAEAFCKCPIPSGNRIAILTDGGGHGVMATDAAERFGLQVPVLSEQTQQRLREILKPHCPIKNPVDLAGTPESDLWVFDRCAQVLLEDPDIDALVVVGLYGGYAGLSEDFAALENQVADSLVARVKASDKPVTMHSIYHSQKPDCLEAISRGGIPVYASVEAALRAMGALYAHDRTRRRMAEIQAEKALPLPADRKQRVAALIDRVKAAGRSCLVEPEALEVLAAYGFDLPGHRMADSRETAVAAFEAFDRPVAMKIVSPDILHKTDAGGVRLNLADADSVATAFDDIVAAARAYKPEADIHGVLIAPMAKAGIECILGSSFDQTFGPTVMFGLGGIFVEILKDVAFRVAPIGRSSAREMVSQIKGNPMLNGARGQRPADKDALAEALERLSLLVAEQQDIAEVDLNPVLAHEQGMTIVDARMVLKG